MVACINPHSSAAFETMLEKAKDLLTTIKLGHLAAVSSNVNPLKYLIKNNVSMFDLDQNKDSVFMKCCEYGRLEHVKVFMKDLKSTISK